MTITVPSADDAAAAVANKNDAQLTEAYGHTINGVKHMFADESVPQHQKINFFTAMGDMGFRGVQAFASVLSGRTNASLALGAGTRDTTPSPTDPAEAVDTTEFDALKDKVEKVQTWVNANKGTNALTGDLVADITTIVRAKETAASTVATDLVKKADGIEFVKELRDIESHNTRFMGGPGKVLSEDDDKARIAATKGLRLLFGVPETD